MSTAREPESPPSKVALQGIRKEFAYKGRRLPVLDSVGFDVQEGEFVSIIGPSGCGKSTLLNIIAGLEEPTEGSLWLNGNLAHRPLGQVGYMHQKDLLLPWRSVLDNAALGLEVQGVPRAQARARALALTERFGLKGFEREYPFALSGGMRQRAAFLRSVLTGKDILLLDEPFGALDALTRAQMQEWLLELWSAFKKTILLVTHDVEEALFLSDRVHVFTARPGRISLTMEVGLPRPRNHDLVTREPFISYKAQLLTAIRQESLSAQEEPWR
ncbi:MAG: ABC transporter ATP-binding protein [Chloroflexi bacterium]|nr:ABC transporter ATP-binding protein [Chloroflexota bacterium]